MWLSGIIYQKLQTRLFIDLYDFINESPCVFVCVSVNTHLLLLEQMVIVTSGFLYHMVITQVWTKKTETILII